MFKGNTLIVILALLTFAVAQETTTTTTMATVTATVTQYQTQTTFVQATVWQTQTQTQHAFTQETVTQTQTQTQTAFTQATVWQTQTQTQTAFTQATVWQTQTQTQTAFTQATVTTTSVQTQTQTEFVTATATVTQTQGATATASVTATATATVTQTQTQTQIAFATVTETSVQTQTQVTFVQSTVTETSVQTQTQTLFSQATVTTTTVQTQTQTDFVQSTVTETSVQTMTATATAVATETATWTSTTTATETAPVTATTTSHYTVTQTATATTTATATSTVTVTAPNTVTVTQTVTPTATTTTTSTSTSTSTQTISPDNLVPDYTPGTQACPKPAVGFVAQHGQLRPHGNKIVDVNGQPVILRGMSLFWSQWYGQFWNSGVVSTLVNDWRVTVVRAAMGVESGGYLSQPATEKQRVINVIEAALDHGIYVIIDWHDHNANQHQNEAKQFFGEIASVYGNCPHIIFETFNEPEWQDWNSVIKPYHEAVVSSIRTKSQNLAVLGSRIWSQALDEVAANPLNSAVYKNIAYTVHFYASTHKQSNRNQVQAAINANLPVLASECGLSEASGTGYVDTNEFNTWVNFLESNYIGWVVWSITDKDETSAALKPGSSTTGVWTTNSYTTAGLHVYNTIRSKQ